MLQLPTITIMMIMMEQAVCMLPCKTKQLSEYSQCLRLNSHCVHIGIEISSQSDLQIQDSHMPTVLVKKCKYKLKNQCR
jgi:hypothetical protein